MSTSGNSSFNGHQNEESVNLAEAVEKQARRVDSATPPTLGTRCDDEVYDVTRVRDDVANEDRAKMKRLAQALAEDRMNDADYGRLTAALRLAATSSGEDSSGAAAPVLSREALPYGGHTLRGLLSVPDMTDEDWQERLRGRHRHVPGGGAQPTSPASASLSSLWGSSESGEEGKGGEGGDDGEDKLTQGTHTATVPRDTAHQHHAVNEEEVHEKHIEVTVNAETSRPLHGDVHPPSRRAWTQRPPPLLLVHNESALSDPPPLLTQALATSTVDLAPVPAQSGTATGQSGRKRGRLHLGTLTAGTPQPPTATALPHSGRRRTLALHPTSPPDLSLALQPTTTATATSRSRRTLNLAAPTPAKPAVREASATIPAQAERSPSAQLDSVATLSTMGPVSSPRGYGPGGGSMAGDRHVSVVSSPFSPGTPAWPGLTPSGTFGGAQDASFPTFDTAAAAAATTSRSCVGHGDEDDLLGDLDVAERVEIGADAGVRAQSTSGVVVNEEAATTSSHSQPLSTAVAMAASAIGLQAAPRLAHTHTGQSKSVSTAIIPPPPPAPTPGARSSPLSPTTHAMLESDSRYASLTPTPAVYSTVPMRRHSQAGVPLPAEPMPIRFDSVKVRVQDHYTFEKKISEGTYGEVYIGVDKRTNEVVALKRLKTLKALDGFPLTSLREVIALKHIEHQRERWRAVQNSREDPLPEIVTLREVLLSGSEPSTANDAEGETEGQRTRADVKASPADPSGRVPHDIYLVFSYASCSLAGLLEKRFHFTTVELTFVFHKILLGVRKLHEMGIIHRDIKADNILLTESAGVQLADFGLCAFASSGKRALTPSMINLSYRPPEMLLGSNAYDERVDVWSVGCLLAQVFLGVPPFFKRRSAGEQQAVQQHNRSAQTELEQLGLICDVLGPLPLRGVFDPSTCKHLDDLQKLRLAYEASGGTATPALHPLFTESFLYRECHGFRGWFTLRVEERRRHIERAPPERRLPILMPTDSCLDALNRVFQLDPKKRPTAAELLKHKFFQFISLSEEAKIRAELAKRLEAYKGSHIAPR